MWTALRMDKNEIFRNTVFYKGARFIGQGLKPFYVDESSSWRKWSSVLGVFQHPIPWAAFAWFGCLSLQVEVFSFSVCLHLGALCIDLRSKQPTAPNLKVLQGCFHVMKSHCEYLQTQGPGTLRMCPPGHTWTPAVCNTMASWALLKMLRAGSLIQEVCSIGSGILSFHSKECWAPLRAITHIRLHGV